MSKSLFKCCGIDLNRVWHCFGTASHTVDLNTVIAMLETSGTNVLPINTHSLSAESGRLGLTIGFGNVLYDDLVERQDLSSMVIMLNINHQLTAKTAVNKTLWAVGLTGEKIIKLEVLQANLTTSNNRELVSAVEILRKWSPHLILMPLIGCKYDDAQRLIELGCPLLRVMGSDIGSRGGIENPKEFERICRLNVPVVMDGGIGNPNHVKQALELGAVGYLVNSALFSNSRGPVETLSTFMRELNFAFRDSLTASP